MTLRSEGGKQGGREKERERGEAMFIWFHHRQPLHWVKIM